MDWKVGIASACALVAVWNGVTLAGAPEANGYVKEALELIERGSLDDAGAKLELAEVELDGVDENAKGPVVKAIHDAKAKIAAAKGAADKPKYMRKLERTMKDAEDAIGNLVTWTGAEQELNQLFDDPAAQSAIPDEIAAAKKKFATFKKVNAKKVAAAKAEQLADQVKYIEEQWKEAKEAFAGDSPASKDRWIERMGDHFSGFNKDIASLDASEDPIKSLKARVDAIAGEFTKVALGEKVKEQVETLNRKVELYKNEWEGWEKEEKGPTYAQMQSESSNAMSYLLMPKTAALISRHTSLLKSLEENDDFKLVASAPEIQSIVAAVKKDIVTATNKASKAANAIVDEAEKAKVKEESELSRVKDAVRLTLGEESEEAKKLIARIEKKIEAHEAATTGAEEAKKKLITDLRAKAEAEWPKLYEGMAYSTDIDLPNQVGKPIGFLADNLMGYRFKPGDFYFATTLGGVPVAGKIDPQLMAQIKATETAIGRSIGDDDGDGKWDCIAIVTDKKVKLLAKRQVDATATVDGQQVNITGEYAEPVDAVVIEIVAAKCGPFAGAKDRGVLKTDGTIGK